MSRVAGAVYCAMSMHPTISGIPFVLSGTIPPVSLLRLSTASTASVSRFCQLSIQPSPHLPKGSTPVPGIIFSGVRDCKIEQEASCSVPQLKLGKTTALFPEINNLCRREAGCLWTVFEEPSIRSRAEAFKAIAEKRSVQGKRQNRAGQGGSDGADDEAFAAPSNGYPAWGKLGKFVWAKTHYLASRRIRGGVPSRFCIRRTDLDFQKA
jgi:hypothetical protein